MSLYPNWWVVLAAVLSAGLLVYLAIGARKMSASLWRRFGIVTCLLLVALRPVGGDSHQEGRTSNLDVVFVVDRTFSMVAEDWDGKRPRMDGVRHDVRAVASQWAGARFALITFDNSARVEMPPTADATALASLVDALPPIRKHYGVGSSIDVPIGVVTEFLERLHKAGPQRQRVVVYLGDGEQTVRAAPKSFAPWKPLISDAVVLGYGTAAGGEMAEDYGDGKVGDPANYSTNALSKIDEKNLTVIADQLGGTYLHRTNPDEPSVPTPSSGLTLGGGTVTGGTELSWIPATALLALALWELWFAGQRHRVVRRQLGGPQK